ncbi:hypothetical protein SLNSH_19160 [Alsobacter soli]|uniref:Uncharacterized protein n=1 Tax=Alsobacter soli TaxID=2109933 RepID=A0A2T1HP42_9HYPH|nr:hypothetical protein [Alsobacter soli]PSC03387.1 hypothetical protein SLNSH_19160 [Alsobacter soli]
MPYLDARAIEIDPEGMDLLRNVIAGAAGGALAYDPAAFQKDGDVLAIAAPRPTVRRPRLWGFPSRDPVPAEAASVIWA